METEFKLPEVSEGVETVDVAEVLVSVGDRINVGDPVCEVETDKAVAEIESDTAGIVREILIKPGDTIAVGQPLLRIETVDESETTSAQPQPDQTSATSADPPAEAASRTADPPPAAPAEPVSEAAAEIVDFRLPSVSEGVDQVDVADVMVKVGDVVDKGDVICEVETDKAVAEIESEYSGTIKAVHVSPGDTIKVGDPLVSIETTSGSAVSPSPPAPASDTGDRQPQAKASAVPAAPTTTTSSPVRAAAVTTVAPTGGQQPSSDRPPAPAGPATRRLARKLGVDLYQVQGTARGGRITIEDVERYVRERMTQPVQPSAAHAAASIGIVAPAPLPDFTRFGPIETEPLNKISRTAAANLSTAWVTIPHVTQHNLADITELETARKRYVKDNPTSPKITMTAIMIKAVVGALRAFPKVNSSIDMANGQLILKKYYHIGVAVDTPNGLVVPVIRNCDQKNVLQVAAELTELATRARDRKLKTEDMQGASFTITNLGGIGGTYFTPIVNPPEVAILGMSRGQKVLQLEDDNIVERLMLPLSLSYDHRAINGADAARFIVKLSGSLTNFFELF